MLVRTFAAIALLFGASAPPSKQFDRAEPLIADGYVQLERHLMEEISDEAVLHDDWYRALRRSRPVDVLRRQENQVLYRDMCRQGTLPLVALTGFMLAHEHDPGQGLAAAADVVAAAARPAFPLLDPIHEFLEQHRGASERIGIYAELLTNYAVSEEGAALVLPSGELNEQEAAAVAAAVLSVRPEEMNPELVWLFFEAAMRAPDVGVRERIVTLLDDFADVPGGGRTAFAALAPEEHPRLPWAIEAVLRSVEEADADAVFRATTLVRRRKDIIEHDPRLLEAIPGRVREMVWMGHRSER
jgi:hypothetical protein